MNTQECLKDFVEFQCLNFGGQAGFIKWIKGHYGTKSSSFVQDHVDEADQDVDI